MPTMTFTPFVSTEAAGFFETSGVDRADEGRVNTFTSSDWIRDIKPATPPVSHFISIDSTTTENEFHGAPNTAYTAAMQLCSLASSDIAAYDPHSDSEVSSYSPIDDQSPLINVFDKTPPEAQPIDQHPPSSARTEHNSELLRITQFAHTLQSLRNHITLTNNNAHINHIRAEAYHAALVFSHQDHDSCCDHTYHTMVEMLAEILFDTANQTREHYTDLPNQVAKCCPGKSSISKLATPSALTTTAASSFYLVNCAGKRFDVLGIGTKGKVVKIAIQSPAEMVAVKKIPLKTIETVLEVFRETVMWSYLANSIDGILPFKNAMIYRSYKDVEIKYLQPEALCFSHFTLAMFSEKLDRLHAGGQQLYYEHYADLARVIANMHRIGFIHNDIKTENILIKKSDNHLKLYLIDFGISFCQDEKISETTLDNRQIGGTYPPPEVSIFRDLSKTVDLNTLTDPQKIDVWAFGQVLLTAWFPEIDDMIEYLTEEYPELHRYDDNISEPLRAYIDYVHKALADSPNYAVMAEIIKHCLAYNPDTRWTMQQVFMALDQAENTNTFIDYSLIAEFNPHDAFMADERT